MIVIHTIRTHEDPDYYYSGAITLEWEEDNPVDGRAHIVWEAFEGGEAKIALTPKDAERLRLALGAYLQVCREAADG